MIDEVANEKHHRTEEAEGEEVLEVMKILK
jgi:hypothetical protein